MQFSSHLSRHLVPACISVACACVCFANAQEAPHLDPYIWAESGQLRTAGWDDATNTLVDSDVRVFGADFGEDPDFPFATDEPGFRSNVLGSTINVNVLSGLSRWNGTEFVSFAAATITAEFGGVSGNTVDGGGFSFLVGEGLHLHPSYFIDGSAGADPSTGVYLVSLNASALSYTTSETFWFVLNLGESEEDHDAAIEWVTATLVPAPAAVIVLAGGLPMGVASRRRRRS